MVAGVSTFSILLSTLLVTLSSLPQFETVDGSDYFPFAVLEAGINIWFTIEYIVRLSFCPDKRR